MEGSKRTVATPEEVANNEKEEKMGLIVSNKIDTSLLTSGDSRLVRYTTLNPDDEDDADVLLSLQNVETALNDMIGKKIRVIGHVISEYPKTVEDEDTGEVKEVKGHSFVLIAEDGTPYKCGSSYAYRCYAEIVAMKKRTPSREEPMTIEVYKAPVKDADGKVDPNKSYLGLKYIKEDK